MNLPICFNSGQTYSIFIESLEQHYLTGRFKANHPDFHFCYAFKGLVYQFTNKIYNFTFSIDWLHFHVPSYTIFTGILKYNAIENESILDLNWLLNTQLHNSHSNYHGHSHLRKDFLNSTSNCIDLPFPILRVKKDNIVL